MNFTGVTLVVFQMVKADFEIIKCDDDLMNNF